MRVDGGDGNCRCCSSALSDTVLTNGNQYTTSADCVVYRVIYDIDGCSGSPCGTGATCTDAVYPSTGYSCACSTGYTGSATTDTAATCTDTDGCDGTDCGTGATCSDVSAPGTGYTCACDSGYTGSTTTDGAATCISDSVSSVVISGMRCITAGDWIGGGTSVSACATACGSNAYFQREDGGGGDDNCRCCTAAALSDSELQANAASNIYRNGLTAVPATPAGPVAVVAAMECTTDQDWLGGTQTTQSCAAACSSYDHFMRVDGGDGNCRCCSSALSDTVLTNGNQYTTSADCVVYRVIYDIDGCSGSPCGTGATCTDAVYPSTGYSCACSTGYTGSATTDTAATCTDTDGCDGTDCGTGATCSDVSAPGTGYTCACDSGYTGSTTTDGAATCISDSVSSVVISGMRCITAGDWIGGGTSVSDCATACGSNAYFQQCSSDLRRNRNDCRGCTRRRRGGYLCGWSDGRHVVWLVC